MKKRTKRLLAMLLASAMILQQGSTVGVLAMESEPASETVAETTAATEAETKTPETQALETKAPETQAAETTATEPQETSETKATEASTNATQTETSASETTETTESAAQSETTETTEKVTEAPATEATEVPAENGEEAEAGDDTDTEKATEQADKTEAPKTNFTYEDSRVKITAVAQEAAKLPQDAQIHADYMQPGTAAYNEAAAALEAAYAGKDVVLSYVFYDIYFTAASVGNGRIEPEAGTVIVSMQFKQPELKPEADVEVQTYDVVHVENGKAQEVPSTVQTTGDGSVASVGFTSGDFSPYAVVMSAEEQDEVATIGTGVPVTIDNTEYVPSSDLKDFVKEAILQDDNHNSIEHDGGDVTLRKYRGYELHLEFAEDENLRGKQFQSPLSYELPTGFEFPSDIQGDFNVTVTTDSGPISVGGNHYEIKDGKLIVNLSLDLNSYGDAKFNLDLSVKTTETLSAGSLDFGDGVQKTVTIDESNSVSVEKSITEYDSDGTAHYKVVVRSSGKNTNVHVKDTFGNKDILKFQQKVEVSSSKGSSVVYTEGGELKCTDDGFECTIASMTDGEEITFTYTAKVDLTNVTQFTTSDEKSNTVSVKSEEDPTGDSDKKEYGDSEHTISYNWVNKDDSTSVTEDTISWSFTVNEDQYTSAAGQTVKDTIADDSRKYLSYHLGDKITVHVYGEDGIEIAEPDRSFTLNEHNILKTEDGKIYGWTYEIPTTDTGKYKYVFEYSTHLNKKGLINDATVTNKAEVEDKGESSGSATITGGKAGIEKTPENITQDEVEWKVVVTVPTDELNSVVITDTLPVAPDGQPWFDELITEGETEEKPYSVEISPEGGYAGDFVLSADRKSFTVTFYKDEEKKTFGLPKVDGEKRTITLKFKTKNNQDWVQHSDEDNRYTEHVNYVKATINTDYDVSTSGKADVRVQHEKSVTKGFYQGVDTEDKITADTLEYRLILTGVDENTLTITDTYSKWLELVGAEESYWFSPQIIGTDTGYDASPNSGKYDGRERDITITADETNHTLTIKAEDVPKDKDGNYYKMYYIYYVMRLKDKTALIEDALVHNGTVIGNSATWSGKTGKAEATFEYSGLTKTCVDAAQSNSWTATFTLDINPEKKDLVEGDSITIQDEMTNLVFKPDTLQVIDADGGTTPIQYIFNCATNEAGHTVLTVTIPNGDEKHIKISYSAQVMGDGKVTYSNNAMIIGTIYDDSYSKEVEVTSLGEGTASQKRLTLYKYREGDISEKLAGARFELYKKDIENDGAWVKLSKQPNGYFETDSQGTVVIEGDASADRWTLSPGDYKLKEIQTPTGYEKNLNKEYPFTIGGTLTGAPNEYIYGGTIMVANEEGNGTTGSLKVKKLVSNPDSLAEDNEGVYTVTVTTDVDLSEADIKVDDETVEVSEDNSFTFTISKDQTVEVTGLPEGAYTVTETVEGATFTAEYNVTAGNGTVAAAGTCATVQVSASATVPEVTITNTYTKPESTTASLQIKKAATEAWTGEIPGIFKFKVEAVTEGAPMPSPAVVTNHGENVSFAAVTYDTEEDYIYKITETEFADTEAHPEWTLNTTAAVYAKVTVTKKTGSNELEAAVSYYSDEDCTIEVLDPKITNTYTQQLGSLKVTKVFSGLSKDQINALKNFKITVTDSSGTEVANWTLTDAKTTTTGYEWTKEDLVPGEYTVTETVEDVSGYTKSTTYSVTVEGKKEVSTDAPTVDVKANKQTLVEITNNYVADGSVQLAVVKKLTGDKPSKDETFTFELHEASSTAENGIGALIDTVTVKGAGTASFEQLTYSEAGTYTYKILEAKGSTAGYTYDETVYTVTVVVAADTLTATVTYAKDSTSTSLKAAEFTNTYTVTDTSVDVEALKVLKAGDEELDLEGEEYEFTLQQVDKSGKAVASGFNDTESNDKDGKVKFTIPCEKAGTYYYQVKETVETDGKIIYDTTAYLVTVVVTEKDAKLNASATVTVDGKEAKDGIVFTNKKTTVKVDKADDKGNKVTGAALTVKDVSSGAVVASWTTTDKTKDLTGVLETGKTYMLEETTVPDGYVKAKPITFKVEPDGMISVDGKAVKDNLLTMVDAKLKLEVNKKAIGSGEELDGAKIEIVDKNGKVVDSWTSKKGETHDFGWALKAGESYTMRETVAPDGYTCVTDMKFTVKEDGTVDGLTSIETKDASGNTVYVIEDSLNKVSIRKLDETGAALAGAKLVVKDASGNVVKDEAGKDLIWTTDGKAHEITGLKKGTYTLSEIEAPEGYQVSKDVTFTITGTEKNGTVIDVPMTDKKVVESNRSLKVTKQLRLEGLSAEGNIVARAATYYVALFEDEARTQRVTDVKKIVFENEAASSVTFENLEEKTYYIGETDENGTLIPGGKLSPRMIYYPIYDGEAMFKLEGRRAEGIAEFTNVYTELPDDFYLAGQLTVTKKVLVNGETADSDDVFYAGVFADAGLTQLVGDVLVLDLAGGSETSVTMTNLTIGNTPGSSRTYYVAETDENGTPLDPDAITEYTISVDKSEVTLSGYDPNQTVVITNDFVEEEESEFESESETEVEKEKTAPKTGDNTDFMKYLLLMTLSAGTCAVLFEEKRRRNRAER